MPNSTESPALVRALRHVARLLAFAAMLAACSGGGGSGAGGSGAGGGQPDLGACAASSLCVQASISPKPAGSQQHVVGTVAEVGPADPAADCAATQVRVIEDGTGVEWVASFAIDGVTLPVTGGDQVELDYLSQGGDIDPPTIEITLTKAGALVVYHGHSTGNLLTLPGGLVASSAEALCVDGAGDQCAFESQALTVTAPGGSVKMKPGESATVGDYRVVLGANGAVHSDGMCDEGSSLRRLAVVPAP